MLSCCSQWEKGRALLIQSFSPIKSTICIANVKERDMTEKDEDDEGAIRFAILESRFVNKKTVRNWLTVKPLCLQNEKMTKAPFALANFTWFNHFGRGRFQISHTYTNIKLLTKACFSCFRQCFSCLLGGENRCNVKKMQILFVVVMHKYFI